MKKFFDSFQKNKGVTFINLVDYFSKTTGEIADHLININLSVKNAKETDLNKLLSFTPQQLVILSKKTNISFNTIETALSEMIEAAKKNLSADPENRTAQSQAQTDAYINLTPALRIHKETGFLHIFGQTIRKTVKVKGEYKTVNSSQKTLAKNEIKKHLDLRSDKFRTFIVSNLDSFKINGEIIEFV